MKYKTLVGCICFAFIASALFADTSGISTYSPTAVGGPSGYQSLFYSSNNNGGFLNPTGDTFSIAALAQDGAIANFISGGESVHTFDSSVETMGANAAGMAGDTFVVNEAVSAVGFAETLIIEVTNLDAAGAPAPWVIPGTLSTGGIPFTTWRIDMGTIAAPTDSLDNPGFGFVLGTDVWEAFDSTGASVMTGNQIASTSPSAGSASLFGIAVVPNGGMDIGGVDIASIQMRWTMVVPEPGSAGILGMVLFGFVIRRRK